MKVFLQIFFILVASMGAGTARGLYAEFSGPAADSCLDRCTKNYEKCSAKCSDREYDCRNRCKIKNAQCNWACTTPPETSI
jgi:hypothetical protein